MGLLVSTLVEIQNEAFIFRSNYMKNGICHQIAYGIMVLLNLENASTLLDFKGYYAFIFR